MASINKDIVKNYNTKDEKNLNWRNKRLIETDINSVLENLLTEEFVVEIRGYKYDVAFEIDKQEIIQCGYSIFPAPYLTEKEIIELGTREGKWFIVSSDKLTELETIKVNEEVERLHKKLHKELVERIFNSDKL